MLRKNHALTPTEPGIAAREAVTEPGSPPEEALNEALRALADPVVLARPPAAPRAPIVHAPQELDAGKPVDVPPPAPRISSFSSRLLSSKARAIAIAAFTVFGGACGVAVWFAAQPEHGPNATAPSSASALRHVDALTAPAPAPTPAPAPSGPEPSAQASGAPKAEARPVDASSRATASSSAAGAPTSNHASSARRAAVTPSPKPPPARVSSAPSAEAPPAPTSKFNHLLLEENK